MKENIKKIYTVATAHLDTCWLWTYEKSIDSFIPGTLKENFRLFRKFPEYKFNFEGSNRYELMEEYYPEDFEKLRAYVKEGRWHPCGSCHENGDVNTPSPEALTRNILYGNGYFREKFGVESNDIYLPDCFGFGRALPSIAAHSGLTGFSTQKLTWGGSVDVPFDIGRWTGKDGKAIWCALKPGPYSSVAGNVRKHKIALSNLKENMEKSAAALTMIYHGTGDRGGAPVVASAKNVVKSMRKNGKSDIKVLSSTTKELFDDLENMSAEEKARMPVYDGELLLTEHGAGSYTSRSVTKRWNRRSELLADAAERFSVAALTEGLADYPQVNFDNAWKKVILHQFHDDITGTSFEECYKRSHNDYVQAMHTFSAEYTAATKALAEALDTSFVKGTAVVVSNPVQNKEVRIQAVSADLSIEDGGFIRVYNSKKKEVPSQKKLLSNGKIRVSFMAEVPSCGVAVYDVQSDKKESKLETELKYSDNVIENKYIRVTLDEKGDIASVYDKVRDREALKSSVKMAIHSDVDSFHWPAWEVKLSDLSRKPYLYPSKPVITVEEAGAALCKIKVVRKADRSSFTQIISLDAESTYVSVENEVDWRQETSLLKAQFNVNAKNEKAAYDIGFGYTERKTNTERLFEVPAQRWAGITDEGEGFGTAIFSDSRTGWDKPDESTIRLTCIHTPLNHYRWECSQHLMDLGLNRFGFAIYPHGDEKEKIMAKADEFCQSMHTFVTDKHKGALKSGYSVVKINSDKARITAVKKAQSSDKVIIRLCEYIGEKQKGVELEFPFAVRSICEVRGDEKEIGAIEAVDGKLKLDLDENQVRSFALEFEKKEKKAESKAYDLPYNAVAITSNKDRHLSTLKSGISIPKELVAERVLTSGVEYSLPQGKLNGLICKGQTIEADRNYSEVSLLLTSLDGDKEVVFIADGKEVKLKLQDCFEAIGVWDLMASKTMGYIKPQAQALSFSHTHSKQKDLTAKQMYFFKADIPVKEKLVLPDDESILILAAAAVKDTAYFEKGDEHFDRLEKRSFDYSFSDYAVKASKPLGYEAVLDRYFDRTESRTVRAFNMCSKMCLGDVYTNIRNISTKMRYPGLKKKILDERK